MQRFTVSGIFESGMYEFDRGLALMHMSDAAKLYRLGDRVTGLRLALDDPFLAPLAGAHRGARHRLRRQGLLRQRLDARSRRIFFRSIELTKSMMFFILLILVVVAAINLVATLVMIVKEKQTDIAILRTIGAAPGQRAAHVPGAGRAHRAGRHDRGCAARLGAGAQRHRSHLHGIESAFGMKFLDASCVPHERSAFRGARRATCCKCRWWRLLLSALATIYPAWRASRTLPAEALRHE